MEEAQNLGATKIPEGLDENIQLEIKDSIKLSFLRSELSSISSQNIKYTFYLNLFLQKR